MKDILAATTLPKMIQEIPHTTGEDTVTRTLRPTDLIRLIRSHNRVKFGQIFGADPVALKQR